ncbi:Sec-independent protein translocase TatB [Ornithinimicrobium cryptoxanthini]|uniref:Sec-independent protein translocase TatB n=1 Tax=Ornithinimicrobium cryptoxanthini TaxID=2934161 RepID=A0ABY4YKG5_9MICO|nr:Sec-independent protein translocase TatB [Ornithinimicrobium cryptoxanthini]USQ77117.1 Sec-independent protein translocase TatB [Ornithinimicrobium cryptoxanthini]
MPNGGEFLLLIVLALVILGPDKLPGYAAKLAQFVRSARDMAEGAKVQIKEELGPGFEDVDWRALDPRQYDPRRIVREALATPGGAQAQAPAETESGRAANEAAIAADRDAGPALLGTRFDPALPTPWDIDAT